jgi:peptidoglycan/LPS O-acetylase OafA/YrhL
MLKQKFYGVDLIRVIACISVCLFHFCNLNVYNAQTYLPTESKLLLFSNIIWYFMFSFFIISSYILFYSLANEQYTLKQYSKFITKRFLRIYPPFLISVIIFILIQYLFTLNPHYQGSVFKIEWSKLISNLLFCPSLFGHQWYNPIYWTLAIEFQFYFVLGIVFPILNSEKFNCNFTFEIIALLFVYLTIYYDSTNYNLNKQTLISYWDLFYLGFILYRYKSNKINLTKAMVIIMFLMFGIFLHYHQSEHYMIFYISIIAILVIFFVNQLPKIFSSMSDISYSFYLTHGFTGGLFLYFTRNIFNDDLTRVVMVFVALIISILGAIPFYKFIEKPWQKRSQKLRLNALNNSPKQGRKKFF